MAVGSIGFDDVGCGAAQDPLIVSIPCPHVNQNAGGTGPLQPPKQVTQTRGLNSSSYVSYGP